MNDFCYQLSEAVRLLATSNGNLKERLAAATTKYLMFANRPDNPSVPMHLREKWAVLMRDLSAKGWSNGPDNDRVGATLHRMQFKTAAKFADRIWDLYEECLDAMQSKVQP